MPHIWWGKCPTFARRRAYGICLMAGWLAFAGHSPHVRPPICGYSPPPPFGGIHGAFVYVYLHLPAFVYVCLNSPKIRRDFIQHLRGIWRTLAGHLPGGEHSWGIHLAAGVHLVADIRGAFAGHLPGGGHLASVWNGRMAGGGRGMGVAGGPWNGHGGRKTQGKRRRPDGHNIWMPVPSGDRYLPYVCPTPTLHRPSAALAALAAAGPPMNKPRV